MNTITKRGEEDTKIKMMNKFVLRQSIILFLAALIWGFAFVAQSVGMDYVEPYTFIVGRNIVALFVLVPCIAVMDKCNRKKGEKEKITKNDKKRLAIGGICCAACLFAASAFQQIGIKETSVGKAGFITAMYMVFVPILGIFLKKKTGLKIWIAVVLALVGMYLLCLTKGDFYLQKGDLYILVSAVIFAIQILAIDHFTLLVDGVKLSCAQILTNVVLGTIMMFLFEQPKIENIFAAWLPIVYAGALSSGVGYTFQIIGQKGMNPTVASLILSLESVISVLAGWLPLHQILTVREMVGCVLAFAAIIIVQLPDRIRK